MSIFDELLRHDGYGEFKVELRILKRGQKEVLLHYGKQYRYVIDFDPAVRLLPSDGEHPSERLLEPPEKKGREEQGV